MLRIMGLMLAGGLVLGTAGAAQAQVGITIGNPAYGNGLYIGSPGYGLGTPYTGLYPGGYSYSSGYTGYSGFVAPRTYVAPPVYGYSAYRAPVYRTYRPAYGYRYGYGYRPGFRPFRRSYW
jgi:hypothetical protein